MCTSQVIELEQGTATRSLHPHNGYYAGDFSRRRPRPNGSMNRLLSGLTALPR